ncbi:MAG: hypothetical protein DRH93_18100, partial [Deltaproteobacteria bacterium]
LITLLLRINIATSSKITSVDRQKLVHTSLKQFDGLTATVIKNLVSDLQGISKDSYAPARQSTFHGACS